MSKPRVCAKMSRRLPPLTPLVALALCHLGAGCMGRISGSLSAPSTAVLGSGSVSGGNGTPGSGGSTSVSSSNDGGAGQTGGGTPSIAYAMVRLTNLQYQNTVQDLFSTVTIPALPLPNENVIDGFNNAATGQTPTSLLVQDYQTAAETITQALSAKMSTVLGCQPTSTTAEQTCAQSFIQSFGKRAYRRPLTTDESSRIYSFFQSARANDDFPTSMGEVIQLLLQSPYFVYRIEAGNGQPTSSGLIPLTSYELASRLSYFLTNSMPDSTLTGLADQDALQDPATLEAQARRLIADPRAHDAVATFNYQWLNLAKLDGLTKDPTTFPNFTANVASSLSNSVVKYIDYAFWQANSLTAMLTDSHAFVNDDLAPIYGVTPPGSSDLQLVNLDPTQRAGILTQAGMMAGLAASATDSPVQRGLLVMSKFLCVSPPPPPPGVNTTPPPYNPSTPTTTRQRMEQSHATGGCQSCHAQMDAIGFAFENYDAVGAWRTEENGFPVDASSYLSGTDVDGTFTGAIALANRLATSSQVANCVSYEWLRYALGLSTTQINLAAAQPLRDAFLAAGGQFTELLVALVKSDYFRSLTVSN